MHFRVRKELSSNNLEKTQKLSPEIHEKSANYVLRKRIQISGTIYFIFDACLAGSGKAPNLRPLLRICQSLLTNEQN